MRTLAPIYFHSWEVLTEDIVGKGQEVDNQNESVFPGPLVEAFRAHPDLPAFEYRSHPVTRGEALGLIGRFATGLRAAGLGPGKSVALAMGVTPEAFAAQIAALLLGCRVTGLRPGLIPAHLAQVLDGETDAVLTDDPDAHPGLTEAARDLPVFRLGPDLLDKHPTPDPDVLTPRGKPADVALINLTSGSTGRPKGCMQTYASMTAQWSWQPARWTERTRRLATGYGRYLLFGTLTSAVIFEHLGLCLLSGGTAVIPEQPFVFPQVFEQYGATACLLTVPRLHHILDTLRTERIDTSSLRVLVVAGSSLAPHRLTEATELLGPVVHHGYGQTETGMLTLLTPDDIAADPEHAVSTVGIPTDTVELTVRDQQGRPVPDGTTGEIWTRTDGAFSGYWNDPEETADVLRDGWVRSRDLGHVDERGFVRLSGRIRDVIIVNAIVHYAGPIERSLAGHPDIDQAYVVAAPDQTTGEAVYAFVVPRAGRTPDMGALKALVAAEVGEGSVPARITVTSEVPVAPSGKPDKKALLTALLGESG